MTTINPRIRTPREAWRRRDKAPRPRYNRARSLPGILAISPWLIGFLIFTIYPFAQSFELALTDWKGIGPKKFIGIRNFVDLFTKDPLFIKSLWNTAYYTIFSLPLQMVVAFLLALLLNQRFRFMPIFRTLFYLPALTAGVASAVLWIYIFGNNGIVNAVLRIFGITGPNWFASTTWAMPALIIASVWGVGQTMVIFLASLQSVPQDVYDAAALDGAGVWAKLRYMTIPLMSPSIFLNLILGVIGSFQTFTVALVVTNGGPEHATTFVLLYIYQNAFRYFRFGYASAMAWVLFFITLLFTIIQFAVAKRWVYYEGAS